MWTTYMSDVWWHSLLREPPIQWELWVDMFEAYVEVLEDQECPLEKYLALLKHRLGAVGLRESTNLPQIENAGGTDVYQLAKKQLQERCGRRINVVLERYKFYSRMQQEDESIDQLVAALRGLAVTCKFKQISYDQVLRDQLLMKTKSCKIQEKLWSCTGDLTLRGAIEMARTIEILEKCVQTIRKNPNDFEPGAAAVSSVNKNTKGFEKNLNWKKNSGKNCYRCGAGDHLANSKKCQALDKICNACRKIGLFTKVCKINMKNVSYVSDHDEVDDCRIQDVVLSVHEDDSNVERKFSKLPTCKIFIDTVEGEDVWYLICNVQPGMLGLAGKQKVGVGRFEEGTVDVDDVHVGCVPAPFATYLK
ncbi:hypothetical protein NDU88_002204 [Pleurodeles waltl]|uniref:Uncharacterized protein n=1 Tax=Pleurodeles waltl TaxID=8319 RepID=A0AAV7RAP5_PLEWA|nr:hypothetical protein NDU88_002204 [Pleurodeles waltl]